MVDRSALLPSETTVARAIVVSRGLSASKSSRAMAILRITATLINFEKGVTTLEESRG